MMNSEGIYAMEIPSDQFLKQLVSDSSTVNIFLISGIKLIGTLRAFDDAALIMSGRTIQFIYKHSIASIEKAPERA